MMDDKIEQFMRDTFAGDEQQGWMVRSLREMTLRICPEAEERIMYGGLVHFVDGELISGIFVRKNHISLEFAEGAGMSDPEGRLEGSGKHRRHLKFRSHDGITAREAEFYLKQAFGD